jgi:dynein heavy chain
MASHMAGYKCIQIEITRGYGSSEFREDLKKLYESAGTKGQDTVFLFTDTQIVVEEFLEDINNILNSGEVPNLFEADEIEKYLQPVRPLAKAAGYPETRDGVFQYFIGFVVNVFFNVVQCYALGIIFILTLQPRSRQAPRCAVHESSWGCVPITMPHVSLNR